MVFLSLDCLYTNTPHIEVNFNVDVIKPGKTLEIPITFYPREAINYRELIPFEINGLSQQTVEIKGKGTEMKVGGSGWGFRTLLPLPNSRRGFRTLLVFLFPDSPPLEPMLLFLASSSLLPGLFYPISGPDTIGSLTK